jgi:hypothetical protein
LKFSVFGFLVYITHPDTSGCLISCWAAPTALRRETPTQRRRIYLLLTAIIAIVPRGTIEAIRWADSTPIHRDTCPAKKRRESESRIAIPRIPTSRDKNGGLPAAGLASVHAWFANPAKKRRRVRVVNAKLSQSPRYIGVPVCRRVNDY